METAIGGFIGLVLVIVVAILIVSALIGLIVLIWKKGIFPMLNKHDDGEQEPTYRT